ncbi:MAG: rhodanese-like domain-containing protein [Saprospiraceae bacterium]|nr:rhodanese-like domain-containing protein [Saprospiraceae bacterium]
MNRLSCFFLLIACAFISCKENVKSSENKVTEFKDLSIEQFMSAYGRERKDSAMLIDVRTPPEFNDGYINGAVMINFLDDDLDKQLGMLDKNISYYIYCQQGGRSKKCMDKMKTMGFNRVYNLLGGYEAYTKMTGK